MKKQLSELWKRLSFLRFIEVTFVLLLNWKEISRQFKNSRLALGVLYPIPQIELAGGGNSKRPDAFAFWFAHAKSSMAAHHQIARLYVSAEPCIDTTSNHDLAFYDFGYKAYIAESWAVKQKQFALAEARHLEGLNRNMKHTVRWYL